MKIEELVQALVKLQEEEGMETVEVLTDCPVHPMFGLHQESLDHVTLDRKEKVAILVTKAAADR